jgi:hypothetical protein
MYVQSSISVNKMLDWMGEGRPWAGGGEKILPLATTTLQRALRPGAWTIPGLIYSTGTFEFTLLLLYTKFGM